MSAKKQGARGGARHVNASMKSLVAAITASVAKDLARRLPSRDEVQDLRRNVRELAVRVEALARRGGGRRVGRPRSNRRCGVQGCGEPHVAKGYCSRHYQAWRRKRMASSSRPSPRKSAARRAAKG